MKLLVKFLCWAALQIATPISYAESVFDERYVTQLSSKLGGRKIESVRKSEYVGLNEVVYDGKIVYVDDKMKFLFIGSMADLDSKENLTANKLAEINRIHFADLPMKYALKKVRGNGARTIAILADPNCAYCKKLEKELEALDNVTVYTFMFNILSENSSSLSRAVWCSNNPVNSWNEWMVQGKLPEILAVRCDSPNEAVLLLGKRLHVTATPSIFFIDGSRFVGAPTAESLEKKFALLRNANAESKAIRK